MYLGNQGAKSVGEEPMSRKRLVVEFDNITYGMPQKVWGTIEQALEDGDFSSLDDCLKFRQATAIRIEESG